MNSQAQNDNLCLNELKKFYENCPGKYCGRLLLNQTSCQFSECQKCPRGYRTDELNICNPCVDQLSLYDFMYILFIFNVSIIFNLLFVDKSFIKVEKKANNIKLTRVACLYILPIVENVLALFVSLMCFPPYGYLNVYACKIKELKDWYTIFFDPYIDYYNKLNCNQEIVYPLYSLVLVFILFATLIMVLTRPCLLRLVFQKQIPSRILHQPIFISLYFFPLLAIFHLTIGGLLYYSFPIIILAFILISNNIHLSSMFKYKSDQKHDLISNIKSAFNFLKRMRNILLTILHWYLYVFAIISITQLRNRIDAVYFLFTPVPLVFFIISYKYTNPEHL